MIQLPQDGAFKYTSVILRRWICRLDIRFFPQSILKSIHPAILKALYGSLVGLLDGSSNLKKQGD